MDEMTFEALLAKSISLSAPVCFPTEKFLGFGIHCLAEIALHILLRHQS
jgi:hypothetical protein